MKFGIPESHKTVLPLGSLSTNCLFLFLLLAFSLCVSTHPGILTIGAPTLTTTGGPKWVTLGGVTVHTRASLLLAILVSETFID